MHCLSCGRDTGRGFVCDECMTLMAEAMWDACYERVIVPHQPIPPFLGGPECSA